MDTVDIEDGEALTGAELFHHLTRQNEQQLAESRRKIKAYTELEDILQNITDRCRLPILAPVASGTAYFEATIDYTNNITVLLGDGWFAERSAKQAREIVGRRLEFLRQEEAVLLREGSALAERQGLFLAEIPNAEQAMAEVEAARADAIHTFKKKNENTITPAGVSTPAPIIDGTPALQFGLEDSDLAVIDEFDELTEEELLQIEHELGEQIEDDELVERIMTERMIEKKEKRLREAQSPTATQALQQYEEKGEKEQPPALTRAPMFNVPGDIGRIASSVVLAAAAGDGDSSRRRVRFNDVVDVVPPPPPPSPPARHVEERPGSCGLCVVGEVVEHHQVTSGSSLLPPVAATADSSPPRPAKKKSIFRNEFEKDKNAKLMKANAVQDDDTPPVIRVEEQRMLRDVHRLIFDTNHTMAELLEDLGNAVVASPQKYTSPAKRVTISEEVTVFCDYPMDMLHLPPAMGLLYSVAFANAQAKAVPNLLRVLELLAEPVSPRARGNILYEEGMLNKQQEAKWREERKKALEEQEIKECTFKPVISDSAKELAPKGLDAFMEKCVEWKNVANARLQKKAAQDRANRGEDELMAQWKMGERSRKLLQQFKKKGGKREKLWKPKRNCDGDASAAPSTRAAGLGMISGATAKGGADALQTPSFHPVTFTAADETLAWLRRGGVGGSNRGGGEDKLLDTTQRSKSSDRSGGSSMEAFLQRVESDRVRRKANFEKLRVSCAEEAKAQLYEKGTGQPLFEPNALPTAVKDGVRISYGDLSKEEQKRLTDVLKKRHLEHVLSRWFRARQEGIDQQGQIQRQRLPEEVVAALLDQTKKQKHLERLRSMACAEETFHPKITARTKKITFGKSWRPVYERPVPKRTLSKSSSQTFTPLAKSSDACIQRVLNRSVDWMDQRQRRLQCTRELMEETLTAECSFRPRRDGSVKASFDKGSPCSRVAENDALVANAEARLFTELELLRSQAALQDETFVSAVRHSLSTVTLANAPRPSRRSIERYSWNLSPMGSSQHSCSRTSSRHVVSCDTSMNIAAAAADDDDYYYDTPEDDDVSDDYNGSQDINRHDEDHSNDDDDDDDGLDNVRGIADSWALLDAQTDSILKTCRYY